MRAHGVNALVMRGDGIRTARSPTARRS